MMMMSTTMVIAERGCWGAGDEWECQGDALEMRKERRT